jgi:hypothetical protein
MNSTKPKNGTSNLIIVALGVACVGLAGWGAYLEQKVEAQEAESAALQAKADAAERKLATAGVKHAATVAAGNAETAAAGSTAPTGTETAATAAEHKRMLNAQEMTALMNNAGMRQIMASQRATVLQMTYGDLMKHLQLTPDEQNYMQRLLVDRQLNLETLGMQLTNPGLSADERGAIVQQLRDAWTSGEGKIKDFINNDADYAYYQGYFQQEPERQEIGMLETGLTGDTALTPATADTLAAALSDARKNYPFTVDFYNKQNWANPQVLNQTAVNQFLDEQTQFQALAAHAAAAVLTPEQMQAFTQNQAGVRQMMKMQLNAVVQMSGGGK